MHNNTLSRKHGLIVLKQSGGRCIYFTGFGNNNRYNQVLEVDMEENEVRVSFMQPLGVNQYIWGKPDQLSVPQGCAPEAGWTRAYLNAHARSNDVQIRPIQ